MDTPSWEWIRGAELNFHGGYFLIKWYENHLLFYYFLDDDWVVFFFLLLYFQTITLFAIITVYNISFCTLWEPEHKLT